MNFHEFPMQNVEQRRIVFLDMAKNDEFDHRILKCHIFRHLGWSFFQVGWIDPPFFIHLHIFFRLRPQSVGCRLHAEPEDRNEWVLEQIHPNKIPHDIYIYSCHKPVVNIGVNM
jgi:hypothetical protein